MTAFLGPVGGLVGFNCPTAVDITAERPMNFKGPTLGGRVKVQRGKASRRAWSVSIGTATPAEVAGLLALELGGRPPWVWVEPLARVTNLLSPEQSVLAPGTWSGAGTVEGGAVTVGGAFSPRSVLHASGGTIDFGFRAGAADRPPVVPGIPVTASAYVRGAGAIGLSWRNYADQEISQHSAAFSNTSLGRVALTNRTPPTGAVSARIWVTGATQAAMPALTWTTDLAPWSVGRGCNRVVVEGLSEAVQLAVVDEPLMRRSSLSFTVREVG